MATINNNNAGLGKMFGKTQIIGILTATTLGIFPLTAAFANNVCCKASGGDNAVIQTSGQDATVSGSGNSIRQNSSQTSNNRYQSGTGDQGIVQDQSQSANSAGHGNQVNQNVRQSNNSQPQSNSSGRTVRRAVSSRSSCSSTCAAVRKGI